MAGIPIPGDTGDFPDNLLDNGRNAAAPKATVEAAMAKRIQYKQHQGRPLFHWWGGWNAGALSFGTSGATVFRFARHNCLDGGGKRLRMEAHVLPPKDPADSATPGIVIAGFNNATGWTASGAYYPNNLLAVGGLTDNDDDENANAVEENTIGFDNVRPVAGCVYEDQIRNITAADTVQYSLIKSGGDVLATQAGSYQTMDRLRDRLNHVHQNRTTQISWACPDNAYVEFNVSPQAYRHVFDQTVGTGGTAPSATATSAITLPNRYAGYGISTLVRVYVYVYAAMSGGTDGGTIAVANLASGSMGAMTALTNGATIGGTGYAWYASLGSFDTASPYFLSPTNVAFDRICLGGRSEGATDKLRIKAWSMVVYPVSD